MSRAAPSQAAYVLHQWDWRESSLILDLFTREQGRVAVVAKGAKRPTSQLRAVLLPFQRLAVQLSRPRAGPSSATAEGTDILTLRAADYAGAGRVLPPARLMAGFYLNELLQKLLARGDPHAALFDAYGDTLQALANDDDEAPLRAFELQLLRHSGWLPEMDRDTVTQQPLRAQGRYALQADLGLVGLAVGPVGPDGGDRMAAGAPGVGLPPGLGPGADAATVGLPGTLCIALAQALALPEALQGAALRAAVRAELPALRRQLRALLAYHLGPSPLRTRQLMRDVHRLLEA